MVSDAPSIHLIFAALLAQVSGMEPDHPVSEPVLQFSGSGVDFTVMLSRVARGGQVILSHKAWDAVKPVLNQHPGAAQV